MIVSVLFIIFVGLGGGITVGAGFVAFLTVMGIIPRLMQAHQNNEICSGL